MTMKDVFYYGTKPNVHPREKFARSIAEARQLCTTDHFWIINEFCDYTSFDWDWDFEFLPDADVWAEDHNNVWPSVHQKDSGTWLCSKNPSDVIIYRADVSPLRRKNELSDNWIMLEKIDIKKFDFSWHPDPTDPPYTYVWGSKFYPASFMPCLKYHVPGAIDVKYMTSIVELEPNWDCLVELQTIDRDSFDLSWRPDPREPPYIYVWGNKWNPVELDPVLEYHTPGATEKKYMLDIIVTPELDRWKLLHEIDKTKFDLSWRPDPREPPYIYVWGNQWNKPEDKAALVYRTPGATEFKYMTERVIKLPCMDNWEQLEKIDTDKFDFSWDPDPHDPPYIYAWGNQWNKPEDKISVQYKVDGATEYKYMTERVIKLPCMDNWEQLEKIDTDKFDFSWEPSPHEPPYIYVWGNQWNKPEDKISVQYKIDGATEYKYMPEKTVRLPQTDNWELIDEIGNFDFSWEPNPHEPPYIYAWGNQWNKPENKISVQYKVTGATDYKYMQERVVKLPSMINWKLFERIDKSKFDFSWEPNPHDPPYIYAWGNQWNKPEDKISVQYVVSNATEFKYMQDRVTRSPCMDNWECPKNINLTSFDFSWEPNPHAPAYIYQFGTLLDDHDGPRYIVSGNTGEIVLLERVIAIVEEPNKQDITFVPQYYITTTLDDLINEHPTEMFWALRENIDYSTFNFDWRPTIEKAKYIHAFGSSDSELTQTYFVSGPMWIKGFREIDWVDDKKLEDVSLHALFKKPDMFYIDRGNAESSDRFQELSKKYPGLQKTRYLNSWVDTINRCINRSSNTLCWILNSELDYSEFDFDYYPNPWQLNMVQVFGTQWSQWGTTFMVNKDTFTTDTKYVKIIEHLSNLNFVKNRTAKVTSCIYEVCVIDHGNPHVETVLSTIRSKISNQTLSVVPYKNSYLDTFKELLESLPKKKEHYIWICSSVCDYSTFDFSYICDPFAKEQLHVFPSNSQAAGDTFLVDVNKLRSLISNMTTLEEYGKINYNKHQKINRIEAPVVHTSSDSHMDNINTDFDFPYAIFTTDGSPVTKQHETTPMSLWSPETKSILITSTGGTTITVPKETKSYVKTQLYDYPYIITMPRLSKSNPLDIVFLSNGEQKADENYEHLLNVTRGVGNRVVQVSGVNGRVQAYHAAAAASDTAWMFTVFAKLVVSEDFDWGWQPDRLQIPKHYIFNAYNPINGLEYGHQGMIAYNKKMTLSNIGSGLDFTLDDPHEVVDIISGVAKFNTDPFSTWRTAFREVIKLRADPSYISKDRLDTWLTVANGDYAEYCINGAKDAIEYYEEVNGELDMLKLSYEWKWLRERFEIATRST